jgi:hypothetical protein
MPRWSLACDCRKVVFNNSVSYLCVQGQSKPNPVVRSSRITGRHRAPFCDTWPLWRRCSSDTGEFCHVRYKACETDGSSTGLLRIRTFEFGRWGRQTACISEMGFRICHQYRWRAYDTLKPRCLDLFQTLLTFMTQLVHSKMISQQID